MTRASWWQLAAPLLLLLLGGGLLRCQGANENTHWMAGEWAQVDYSIYHTKCASLSNRASLITPDDLLRFLEYDWCPVLPLCPPNLVWQVKSQTSLAPHKVRLLWPRPQGVTRAVSLAALVSPS